MKKFVIATILALLLVSMVATTVFAKHQPYNPKANESACYGQSVKDQEATNGTMGDTAKEAAQGGLSPGVAADIHYLRCY